MLLQRLMFESQWTSDWGFTSRAMNLKSASAENQLVCCVAQATPQQELWTQPTALLSASPVTT